MYQWKNLKTLCLHFIPGGFAHLLYYKYPNLILLEKCFPTMYNTYHFEMFLAMTIFHLHHATRYHHPPLFSLLYFKYRCRYRSLRFLVASLSGRFSYHCFVNFSFIVRRFDILALISGTQLWTMSGRYSYIYDSNVIWETLLNTDHNVDTKTRRCTAICE